MNLLLGVTGSVAAIKTLLLAEKLQKFGNVQIVLTQSAEYFVQADLDALRSLDIPIRRDRDEWPELKGPYSVGEPILHIELRRWADLLLVAPLDANTLAKITFGICDNLLTSVVRAWDWKKPVLLCPAMNTYMWENPPTANQITEMQDRGCSVIFPIEKHLACNDIGMGAMAEVEAIVEQVRGKMA